MENTRGSEWNRWDLHLHTASSYDAKYKGNDADQLLCAALKEKHIKAVAITDHFVIDKDRIEHLRSIAPDIVFFPGVELRTDKNANNLHIILIFDCESRLSELAEDFNAIMYRQKAKAKEADETIYWDFNDIVEFANEHDALISIHAGRKVNGIDKELPNSKALPHQFAAKDEIGKKIHFFEVGQKRDIDDYKKYIWPSVGKKPIIICSDCHDPREYEQKAPLWIKSKFTFAGLKQCLYQPEERVFVGDIPPALDRICKNKQVNIDTIAVHRKTDCVYKDMKCFDFQIPLNAGLVSIIGNKGSGKSALSDIIGHLCKSKTMDHASFLNEERFRKRPKNFADDYEGIITWVDGHSEEDSLGNSEYESSIEDAQYLPQKYIEVVCNDIGEVFQSEIDKVIFSYVDRTERASATNLVELVENRSKSLVIEKNSLIQQIHEINSQIIKLENKRTSTYKKLILDSVEKQKASLQRHEESKPVEVKKPEAKENDDVYQQKLGSINKARNECSENIERHKNRQAEITSIVIEANELKAKIKAIEENIEAVNILLTEFAIKTNIDVQTLTLQLTSPHKILSEVIKKLEKEKEELKNSIDKLEIKNKELKIEKESLIASADSEEKQYQRYLQDFEEWKKQRGNIIGTKEQEGTLAYYECEAQYINEKLSDDYQNNVHKREQLVRQLYGTKKALTDIYQDIYSPVEGEISTLLGDLEDSISFQAEIRLMDTAFDEKALHYINLKYAGMFKGREKMSKLVRSTEFENEDSVIILLDKIMEVVEEDIDNSAKKIVDKQGFYDYLFSLEYIGVSFKLKMGNRDLSELSPGERGIVLLIFYLALSKNKMPIIIDQPEDNLDNQSVYSKLVPCICKAKQKRQVIIVTHNPNIAVACDAEQIIYCNMDKNSFSITYEAGAIEDPIIKNRVIDVLEGTMPAFDLRRKKYEN